MYYSVKLRIILFGLESTCKWKWRKKIPDQGYNFFLYLIGLNSFKTVNFLVPNFCSLLMAIHFYLLLNFVQKRLESMHRYFMRYSSSFYGPDELRFVSNLRSSMKLELPSPFISCSKSSFIIYWLIGWCWIQNDFRKQELNSHSYWYF